MQDLLSLTLPALNQFLERIQVGAHHSARLFRALHCQQSPIQGLHQLGERRLQILKQRSYQVQAKLLDLLPASDGSSRLLLRLEDGIKLEAVLIPKASGRLTLCLSTQAGCAMGCRFCATAQLGLKRDLSTGEIIAQVQAAQRWLRGQGEQKISHLVFMGMGEPLQNYEALRDAIQILKDPAGLAMRGRWMSVSTVGLVPGMLRFAQDFGNRVQLALSLHAGRDETRRQIVPMAKRWDLAQLKEACLAQRLSKTRYLMLEYVLLPGVNDSLEELNALAEWTQGLYCILNLIPFNPFPNALFRTPSAEESKRALKILRDLKVPTTLRRSRGAEVSAACGQLALRGSS